MDNKRIWAPWRIGYVAGKASVDEETQEPESWQQGAEQRCFLCRAGAKYEDAAAANRQNLVVCVRKHTVVLLNRYPYANGHLLISPLRHVADLHDLTAEEHLELMEHLAHFTQLLGKIICAEGFNVGLNLGQVAGAGVPGHLHWHLVPRWTGDHNFMPTLAGIRVIPQSLEAVWEALMESESQN